MHFVNTAWPSNIGHGTSFSDAATVSVNEINVKINNINQRVSMKHIKRIILDLSRVNWLDFPIISLNKAAKSFQETTVIK